MMGHDGVPRPTPSEARRTGLPRRQVDRDQQQVIAAAALALDSLNYGVALVGSARQVHFINRLGRTLCEQNEGLLRLQQGRLVASCAADSMQLNAAMARIAGGNTGAAIRFGRRGERPLSLVIKPLPGPAPEASERHAAMALLLFADPARLPPIPPERLMQAYGLTGTEASVASLLLQGRALAQIAERLDIRLATARSHLKAVLAKTGTHRQSELVCWLLQEVGWLL